MTRLSRRELLRSTAAFGGLALLQSCAPAAAPAPPATATGGPASPAPIASATPRPTSAKAAWVALTSNQMLWPVALEAGYFKKYGLDLDLSYIAPSTNAMAALLSGQIGLTSVAGSAVVTATAGGADVVMIAGFVNKMIFRIMVPPSITSVDQLKGTTIAVTRVGSADYFAWQTIAAKQGWKVDDLVFIAASDPPGQVAALVAGRTSAIAVSPPNNILAVKAGAKEILDMASYNEPEQNVGVAVSRKYLADNRAAAVAVMQGSIEAIARWKKDPAFVKDVIKKYLKNDEPDFLDVGYSAYRDIFQQAPYPSEEGLRKVIEEVAAQEPRSRGLKTADLIDRSVVQELETSGFITRVFAQ